MKKSINADHKKTCRTYLLHAGESRDDLVAVALVDEEALSLPGEAHLHCVLRHQRVEEGVILFGDGTWRSHDRICQAIFEELRLNEAEITRILPARRLLGRQTNEREGEPCTCEKTCVAR